MVHQFEMHLSPSYFPMVKVTKPFYTTVRYMVRDKQVYGVSLEFSSLALKHITGVAQISMEAEEAAKGNAVFLGLIEGSNDIPSELFTK